MSNKYYALIGRTFSYFGQFLVIVTLPLILPPNLFAKFNMVIPILTIISSVLFGWLNGAAFRWSHRVISENKYILKSAIKSYYILLFVLAVCCGIIFVCLGKFSEAIFFLIIFVIAVKDYFLKISNSTEDYKKFALANAYLALGKIIFLVILFKKNDNILIIFSIFLVSELFFLLPFVNRGSRQRSICLKRRVSALMLMLRYGGPLIVASVAVWLISLSDRYILSYFMNTHEVANYILVYQFSANAITIPVIFFITVYYPKLIRMDRELGLVTTLEYNAKMLKKYFIIAPIFGIFISLIIWVAIRYFYTDYTASIFVIMIIVSAQILCGAGHFYNKKYELNNKTHYIATAVLASAVVNVGSNFLLVPKMGLTGAALSSLTAYLFLLIFTMNADRIIPQAKGNYK